MARRNFAASRPVNPPTVLPRLSEAQVWKGLGIKARNPQSFVPVITSCDIRSDDGERIVRSVRFGDSEPVIESIELFEPTVAYFEMSSTGIRITNVLSYDADGELVLTFTFANGIPGIRPDESFADMKELNAVVGRGVEQTIKRIRELVTEGVI